MNPDNGLAWAEDMRDRQEPPEPLIGFRPDDEEEEN